MTDAQKHARDLIECAIENIEYAEIVEHLEWNDIPRSDSRALAEAVSHAIDHATITFPEDEQGWPLKVVIRGGSVTHSARLAMVVQTACGKTEPTDVLGNKLLDRDCLHCQKETTSD